MLLSLAYLLISGMVVGFVMKKFNLPSLFGMILVGMVLGPQIFNLLDPSLLSISTSLRKIALIIILIRAGLKLSLMELKKVGRRALLMSFVPASLEIVGFILLAPKLLGLSVLDSAILGAVIAAVSPAVVVPRMIQLMDEGYGVSKGIPQMILSGASVDDVYVIVLFSTFTSIAKGNSFNVMSIVRIPISILIGIVIGFLVSLLLLKINQKIVLKETTLVTALMALSFLFCSFEDAFGKVIPFASLIAVMAMGLGVQTKTPSLAITLSKVFDQLWYVAEIFLFVLVGASVRLDSLQSAGLMAILLIAITLMFRMIGVWLCLFKTKLNFKEKLFTLGAYTPKATVQAAIGGLPLSMGIASGNTILTVSVVSILLTAPIGAYFIDTSYRKFLSK